MLVQRSMLVQGVDRYARATSARAGKESASYLCGSNVTPTAVRFIGICFSVFVVLLSNVFHKNDMFANYYNYYNVGRTLPEKSAEKKTKKLPVADWAL